MSSNTEKVVESRSFPGGRREMFPVVTEVPVDVYLNDRALVTILCLGDHLEEMVAGFLFSEALIDSVDEIANLSTDEDRGIVSVEIIRPSEEIERAGSRRVLGSGCGRGIGFFDVMGAFTMSPVRGGKEVTSSQLVSLMKMLHNESGLYRATRAVHNVALCDDDSILVFRSDIGRHNALDKVCGHCLLRGVDTTDKILLITGRITVEMLVKAGRMGVPVVVSRSAPTDMSVRLAGHLGITLVCFVKGGAMRVFSGFERVTD